MPDSIDKLVKSSYSYCDMSFTKDDQQKYKSLYLQTARQYTVELQDNLLQLNTKNNNSEIKSTLHRAAHSLKGQSEMMGYTNISSLASLLEEIFLAVKENKIMLSEVLIKKLLETVEAMNSCLDEIEQKNKEIDLSSIIDDLHALIKITPES
jgi:two-component system, chemotaxis family, sensor kinase CheA